MTEFQKMIEQLQAVEFKQAWVRSYAVSSAAYAKQALDRNEIEKVHFWLDRIAMINGAYLYLKTGVSDYV